MLNLVFSFLCNWFCLLFPLLRHVFFLSIISNSFLPIVGWFHCHKPGSFLSQFYLFILFCLLQLMSSRSQTSFTFYMLNYTIVNRSSFVLVSPLKAFRLIKMFSSIWQKKGLRFESHLLCSNTGPHPNVSI